MEMSWSNGRNAWSKGRHSNMKKVSCTKAATGGVLQKKVLLEILLNSQENTCASVSES